MPGARELTCGEGVAAVRKVFHTKESDGRRTFGYGCELGTVAGGDLKGRRVGGALGGGNLGGVSKRELAVDWRKDVVGGYAVNSRRKQLKR